MAARVVLITGASSGIGAALARAYAGPSVTLVLAGRDPARLAESAAACVGLGAETRTIALDLADCDAMLAAFAARDAAEPIDTVILNAGRGDVPRRGEAAETPEMARALVDVNFRATVVGASFFAGRMAARGGGRIAIVSSFGAFVPIAAAPVYTATKAGLSSHARSLGAALRRTGVSVTLLCPGFIDTPMNRSLKAPQPFKIGADLAAAAMKRAIEARRRELVLPWQFAVLRRLLALVPDPVIGWATSLVRVERTQRR